VGENYQKLSMILKNMEEFNPILLEQLHYYYTIDVDKAFSLSNKIALAVKNAELKKGLSKYVSYFQSFTAAKNEFEEEEV
jgi:hypothetical protein